MVVHTTTDRKRGYAHHYYRCAKRNRHGSQHACTHGEHHRAQELEESVWELVSGLLKDPARLRAGLEKLIEQERAGMRGDPERETKAWLEKLSKVEEERRNYIRLAGKGYMTDDDLGEALAELEDTRATAEKELKIIRGRQAALEELERDRDTLLESYAAMMPEALDALVPEERQQVYMMLRLKVELSRDESIEVRGVLSDSLRGPLEDGEGLCESELASASTTS